MSKKLTFREFHLFKKLKSKKIPFCLQDLKLRCNFAPVKKRTTLGKMVEWSITPVLKTGVPRGTGGSNPSLSAISG